MKTSGRANGAGDSMGGVSSTRPLLLAGLGPGDQRGPAKLPPRADFEAGQLAAVAQLPCFVLADSEQSAHLRETQQPFGVGPARDGRGRVSGHWSPPRAPR